MSGMCPTIDHCGTQGSSKSCAPFVSALVWIHLQNMCDLTHLYDWPKSTKMRLFACYPSCIGCTELLNKMPNIVASFIYFNASVFAFVCEGFHLKCVLTGAPFGPRGPGKPGSPLGPGPPL